jgi:hypothetical protein
MRREGSPAGVEKLDSLWPFIRIAALSMFSRPQRKSSQTNQRIHPRVVSACACLAQKSTSKLQ